MSNKKTNEIQGFKKQTKKYYSYHKKFKMTRKKKSLLREKEIKNSLKKRNSEKSNIYHQKKV